MQSRVLHRLLATLLVGLLSLPAAAQLKREASATKKIDEAINTHYLMMELDKAEAMLKGIVDACADQCSTATKAKAWMYVGLVRGSGKNDLKGATEAFATAKSIDPAVVLDQELATPETKAAFESTPGGSGAPAQPAQAEPTAAAPAAKTPSPAAKARSGDVPGDMICTPEVAEIQTRMPIPISCQSDLDVATVVLKFKEFGSSDWKKIDMKKVGDSFQAEIPCDITGVAGPLEYYVGAKDASGEYVDQWGSKKQPASFNLSESGSSDLAFPGQVPVSRCASASDCPPDFPGCGGSGSDRVCGELDWGAACSNSTECKCGLTCDGTCVQAAACTADTDCGGGEACFDGFCGVAGGAGSGGPYSKHWLGVSLGADVTFLGGAQLCTDSRRDTYSTYCLTVSDPATGQGAGARYTGAEAKIDGGGPAMGQVRFKLAYDYALSDHMLLGARLGFGFVNAPVPQANVMAPYMPISLEARFSYALSALGKTGFRPTLFVDAGLMEVSTAIPLGPNVAENRPLGIYIHKRAGLFGAGAGLNLGYAIKPNMVLAGEVTAYFLFGVFAASVAIHPGLTFTYAL